MKQVVISQQEEKEGGKTYYKARLIDNGKLVEGDVQFPKEFRDSQNKVGNIYDLKTQNVEQKSGKGGKKIWVAAPQHADDPSRSHGRYTDCHGGKFCSILPCNCVKKTG